MRWIEANVGSGTLDEFSIGRKLEEFRRAEPLYVQPANIPIIGYGENAALPHYRPAETMTSSVKPEGFLLFDICAHYLCGTTDLTRTIAVGELTDEMKLDYTVTLKSHLVISRQKFPYGVTGNLIDAIVKSNHWDYLMNFGHGTGHGMGYILNVHEGPGKIIMEYAPLFPYARNPACCFPTNLVFTNPVATAFGSKTPCLYKRRKKTSLANLWNLKPSRSCLTNARPSSLKSSNLKNLIGLIAITRQSTKNFRRISTTKKKLG